MLNGPTYALVEPTNRAGSLQSYEDIKNVTMPRPSKRSNFPMLSGQLKELSYSADSEPNQKKAPSPVSNVLLDSIYKS
jgi:hypothetical protein